jgi:N-acetylglutamate synthase-like GNAT family acetyltransferase
MGWGDFLKNLQEVLALDLSFLETFTNRIDTAWGSIFYNENQPNYYDSNHALICEAPDNPQLVIDEVIHFYSSRNIIPRFYLYHLVHLQNLLSELKSKGFKYEELTNPVQLWNNRIMGIEHNPKATIEKVTAKNVQEALEIECSIKEFGGKNAVEKVFLEQFSHPAFTHYLLRYDNKACSTACVFEDENQARMESVATLEEFRGKGLIGEVIHFIQKEVANRGIEKLWVLPISERVEKVYQKYGFETVGKLKTGHAFLAGKSIKEIQGS